MKKQLAVGSMCASSNLAEKTQHAPQTQRMAREECSTVASVKAQKHKDE